MRKSPSGLFLCEAERYTVGMENISSLPTERVATVTDLQEWSARHPRTDIGRRAVGKCVRHPARGIEPVEATILRLTRIADESDRPLPDDDPDGNDAA